MGQPASPLAALPLRWRVMAAGEKVDLHGVRAVRLVARQVSELMLVRGLRWQASLGVDRLDATVQGTAFVANIAHLPLRAREDGRWLGLLAPDELRRPVSVNSIARSTNLPYETVRRRLATLEAAGLVRPQDRGFVVPAALMATPSCRLLPRHDAAALIEAMGALALVGHAPSIGAMAAGPGVVPDDVMSRLLLEFAIHCMDVLISLYGDVISGTIAVAITASNVRHILTDPVLARRYAGSDEVPPDSERRPIPVRTLARELALPFETVRRRTMALVQQGKVEMLPDGVIVPTHVLMDEKQRSAGLFTAAQFERLIETVARLAGGASGSETGA